MSHALICPGSSVALQRIGVRRRRLPPRARRRSVDEWGLKSQQRSTCGWCRHVRTLPTDDTFGARSGDEPHRRRAIIVPSPAERRRRGVACGPSVGLLTAYAQRWLSDGLGSIANSAGPRSLAAFLVAMLTRRPGLAAVMAMLVLDACEVGNAIATELRGDSNATSTVAFWLTAAVLAGPPLGVAGAWTRQSGWWFGASTGPAVLAGVLIESRSTPSRRSQTQQRRPIGGASSLSESWLSFSLVTEFFAGTIDRPWRFPSASVQPPRGRRRRGHRSLRLTARRDVWRSMSLITSSGRSSRCPWRTACPDWHRSGKDRGWSAGLRFGPPDAAAEVHGVRWLEAERCVATGPLPGAVTKMSGQTDGSRRRRHSRRSTCRCRNGCGDR